MTNTAYRPSAIFGGRDESFERFVDEFSRRVAAELVASRAAEAAASAQRARLETRPSRSYTSNERPRS